MVVGTTIEPPTPSAVMVTIPDGPAVGAAGPPAPRLNTIVLDRLPGSTVNGPDGVGGVMEAAGGSTWLSACGAEIGGV